MTDRVNTSLTMMLAQVRADVRWLYGAAVLAITPLAELATTGCGSIVAADTTPCEYML